VDKVTIRHSHVGLSGRRALNAEIPLSSGERIRAIDFERLRAETRCPFAKAAKVWFGPDWLPKLGWSGNVARHAVELRLFAERAATERYHGFASEVRIGPRAVDFESVRAGFRDYLGSLAEADPDCARSLAADLTVKEWQFEFSGVRMFLNVFAPCYPQPHSKRLQSENAFWVFFQPEFAFDLCNIDPRSVATKQRIREAFAAAGMPYNGSQIDARLEAFLYMFPVDPAGEPVRWWDGADTGFGRDPLEPDQRITHGRARPRGCTQ
jgi:hypothetical protein